MSDVIEISYIWDRDTYIHASKLAYDYEMKHSVKRYNGWIFIALLQFGVVSAMKQGTIGLLMVSTILLVYWYALRWPLRNYFVAKSFDKSPNANKQFTIKVSDVGLTVDDNTVALEEIDGVLVLSDGVFIYIDAQSVFIPNKALSIDRRNDLLNLLKKHVDNYTKES